MTRDKHCDLPDGFDALLRSEMAVEPSTAFVPRVRERLDSEPAPRFWHGWMTLAAAAGAVCAVLVAGAAVNLRIASRPAAPQAPVLLTGAPIARPPGVPSLAQPLRAGAAAVIQSSRPAAEIRSGDSPVVLVDERQHTALMTLFQMVREGRLTEKTASSVQTSLEPIREQVAPVSVKPLEVSPIVLGGVLQNEK